MTACAFCGADGAAAIGKTWSFFIDRQPSSLNARVFNAGSKRWAYAAERDLWIEEIWASRVQNRIGKASGKRRVIVKRVYCGREKERDYVNLVGGCKPLIDALVREELLIDDSPIYLEDHYQQQRTAEDSGVWVTIEDLA